MGLQPIIEIVGIFWDILFCPPSPNLMGLYFCATRRTCYFLHSNVLYEQHIIFHVGGRGSGVAGLSEDTMHSSWIWFPIKVKPGTLGIQGVHLKVETRPYAHLLFIDACYIPTHNFRWVEKFKKITVLSKKKKTDPFLSLLGANP